MLQPMSLYSANLDTQFLIPAVRKTSTRRFYEAEQKKVEMGIDEHSEMGPGSM